MFYFLILQGNATVFITDLPLTTESYAKCHLFIY